MAQNRRPVPNKRQASRLAPQTRTLHRIADIQRQPTVVYGKPILVLEDEAKNTFVYQGGQWVAYGATIAECRQTCLVKELPQRVNKMVRYEVREPVGKR